MKNSIQGVYLQQYQYKCFLPSLVNVEWTWDDPLINTMLEEATRKLGELNAFSLIVPDIDLYLHMHVLKEANQSSRIEGTQTHIDDAVLDLSQIDPEKRDDAHEVHNYVKAMHYALEELTNLPLSIRLLKQTHAVLMQGVRGEHKSPGEIRSSQNWIGGSNLQNAVFIPPVHHEIPPLLRDLEKFWHNDTIHVPDLIKIAISHYQFETIHPFLDGNGRIGRLLITLYLVSHGLLNKPSLYLSDFLEQHRGSYYDALTIVRNTNDMKHWIKFFLTAVSETAEKGKNTLQAILSLRHELESQMVTFGKRSENARSLLMFLYRKPAVSVKEVAAQLSVTNKTANDLVKQFVDTGILKEITGHDRYRLFLFRKYLELFA